MTKITEHFTLGELTTTEIAARRPAALVGVETPSCRFLGAFRKPAELIPI